MPRAFFRFWLLALRSGLIVFVALCTAPAAAHPPLSTTAVIKIDPAGRVSVAVSFDALAFALNDTSQNIPDPPMYELLGSGDAELSRAMDESRDRFQTLFELRAGDQPVPITIDEFPTRDSIRQWSSEHPDRRLPVRMIIQASAQLPPTVRPAGEIRVRFPDVMGDVIITFDRPGVEPAAFPLAPGELSPPVELVVPGAAAGGQAVAHPSPPPAPPVSAWGTIWRYTRLGYTHIIPRGADHALFVLGLFLLTPRLKAVLWQITAFTIAHSVTLMLTTFGLVRLPSAIIEPAIAASIAFVAVENLLTTRVHPWRIAVAFLFGLVHGMGFASALREVGLPTGQLVAGVLAFNVGVEGGHLSILAAALLCLGWWRERPWYRSRISIPLSVLIAAVALVWMGQRLVAPGGLLSPGPAAATRPREP